MSQYGEIFPLNPPLGGPIGTKNYYSKFRVTNEVGNNQNRINAEKAIKNTLKKRQ